MPERDGELQYRIKNTAEQHERMRANYRHTSAANRYLDDRSDFPANFAELLNAPCDA
jgi:hypothetical protein